MIKTKDTIEQVTSYIEEFNRLHEQKPLLKEDCQTNLRKANDFIIEIVNAKTFLENSLHKNEN